MSQHLHSRVVFAVGTLLGLGIGTLFAQQEEKSPTPIRQNPNIVRPITNENFDSAVVNILQQLVSAYGPIADSNQRPNPYTRIEPFGEPPPGNNGEWAAVTGAEGGPDGNLYVLHRCRSNSCVDRPEPPIVKLDPRTGKRLDTWGEGLMDFPHGFHVDFEGNVWTTDTGSGKGPGGHLVRKFGASGELLMTIGRPGVAGDGPDTLREPTDVVVSREGAIFVTEGHVKNGPHARLAKFAPDGSFVARFGSTGQGHLQLSAPHGIALDTEGRLFIADRDNNRILIWDQDGNYIDQWTQFGRPSGVYIDHTDTIYVADSESWGPDNPGWLKGIRIGSARTGQVHYFLEDIESRDFSHSGAEAIGVDALGNVYGGVVRRQMLERHEPGSEQPTRGATWQAPRRSADEDVIRSIRTASNAAIKGRSLPALRKTWFEDLHITSSSGDAVGSGEEMALRFVRAFEDPEFMTYVRTPTSITVSEGGHFGAESGEWVGTWRKKDGEMNVRGTYLAQWQKREGDWRIRSEVFVALTCSGSASCSERR